jgi:DHA2 family multidrug resistance protein
VTSAATLSAAAPSAPAAGEKVDRGKLAIFAVMVVGMFMAVLDIQIVAASIPQIQAGLAASADEISWVQTSYLIAEVAMIPMTGYLSRALSTRVLFCLSAGGFTLASLGCALAWDLNSLIVMRAIQGFLGGAMIPTVFATAFIAFPRDKQAPISAAIGLIVTLAPTIGPTLGGYISEHLSWHWLFLVNIVPGALICVIVWLYGDFDKADFSLLRRLDVLGFILMALALGLAEFVLEEGPDEDWFADRWISMFTIVAIVSFAFFVHRMLRSSNPIVDLRTFTNRNFTVGSIAAFAMGAVLFGLVYILPLFLARVRDYNSLQIGETLFVTGGAMFLAAPAAAMLSRKIDPRIVASAGFALAGVSTWMLSQVTSEWGYWQLFWPQVARGAGMMLAMAPLNVIALGTLTPLQVRGGAGLYNLMRNLGGAFGLAIINTMLNDRTRFHARVLSDNLNEGRNAVTARMDELTAAFAAQGASDPHAAAVQTLSYLVQREASVLAFADVLHFVFLIAIAASVILFFVKPPKAVAAGAH